MITLLNAPDNDRTRQMLDLSDANTRRVLGEVIVFRPETHTEADFRAALVRADVMLSTWGSRPLTAADWQARCDARAELAPFLVMHGAGSVRSFVPPALLHDGVRVSQSASVMAPAVAQFTVGLIVLALRQGFARTEAQKRGGAKNPSLYRDLRGLTVGLVGLSQIGRRMPALLAPFEPGRIIAYDPYFSPDEAARLNVELMPLDELLKTSDVVSLHAPVTPETRNMLNAARVASLVDGAVVINTARAALVDQNALFARANLGEITYYADVTEPEPLPPPHPVWQNPHVLITPHIGGVTKQTLEQIGAFAVLEIERFQNNAPLHGAITAERYEVLA